MTFEEFAKLYSNPKNRGDMKRAERRFIEICKNGNLPELISALGGYEAYQRLNKWYQPLQLATFLGCRWRDFVPEKTNASFMSGMTELTPMLKESQLQERAIEVREDQLRMQVRWDKAAEGHQCEGDCFPFNCRYAKTRRPKVRDIDEVVASLRGSEGI